MARYRKIACQMWNDEKFRMLSDSGKLCFVFVLTHQNMTSIGAMRATIPGLAAELGWTAEAFREAFQEALSKGMAKHDETASLIALPQFLRHNPPESPNVVKSWESQLELLPECRLQVEYLQRAKAFVEGLGEAFRKALPKAFAKGMPNPEPEPEPEPEINTPLPPKGGKARDSTMRFDPLKAAIPPAIDTPRFRAAWSAWTSHRREIKHPLRKTMVAKQLQEMAEIGEARAVAMINHTITKGWQGLQEPDHAHHHRNGSAGVPRATASVRVVSEGPGSVIAQLAEERGRGANSPQRPTGDSRPMPGRADGCDS